MEKKLNFYVLGVGKQEILMSTTKGVPIITKDNGTPPPFKYKPPTQVTSFKMVEFSDKFWKGWKIREKF